MKWAQTKKVLDGDGVLSHDRTHFKEYETKNELEKDLMDDKKFVKWATFDTFPLNRKAQRRYEIYCGGFLYYHDVEFKKYPKGAGYEYPDPEGPGIVPKWKTYPDKDFEHIIYLRWLKEDGKEYIPNEEGIEENEKKKEKNHKVIIYINPTPPAYNGNPPTPPPPPPPES